MKSRQKWTVGDLVLLRLADGTFAVAQIVGKEPEALNSVTLAIFDQRYAGVEEAHEAELADEDLIAVLFTTPDLLNRGEWKVVESRPVAVDRDKMPNEDLRRSGFVGAKIYGSGIVERFANAFYALGPWDYYHDPKYFDNLLISPDKKPTRLVFSK
jgi:hypothetical protein